MLGQGQISTDGRNNVQFVCDFTLAGVSPTTDVLTDVVWQKVGRPAYMNNPMTSVSGYPNLLNCPNTYVSSTPTNYGFNIAGPKTTLVIKNATAADYGVYRCYATKVSRQTPRQRTPVYMEVYYGPSGTSGRH
ncbi:uncharacterized protein LOC122393475 [Amphibalanus amphitrite]|uniref:uncharacterized protein LOC122393475 n=1 Tax=Amphibalanus amphitrite TaxID=1232801 RepID=UPI001C904328|nr:uncharacterized protein LOC122393475 [Amphibalanus amphitrite]